MSLYVVRSFLKWAGGKHRVASSINEIITDSPPLGIDWRIRPGERYHEPFLGSGSMYFSLREMGIIKTKKYSFLSDINPILIRTMQVVRDENCVPQLLDRLRDLQRKYPLDLPHPNPRGQQKSIREERLFYRMRKKMNDLAPDIRSMDVEDSIELSSLAIFLNKTCYNGLWRVNSSGEFNTPEGDYFQPKNIAQEDVLWSCQKMLKKAKLECRDWEDSLNDADSGDLVYLDPPYMPLKIGGEVFTNYFTSGFTIEDHKRLAYASVEAAKRGVRIISSNHDAEGNPNVREIYGNAAKKIGIPTPEVKSIDVTRTINCKGHGRVKVTEVLIFLGKKI